MLLLNEDEVQKFLSMDECISAVEEAFKSLGGGRAYNLPRGRIRTDPFEGKYSYWMNCIPGAVPELGVAALRIDSAVQILSDDPEPDPRRASGLPLLRSGSPLRYCHGSAARNASGFHALRRARGRDDCRWSEAARSRRCKPRGSFRLRQASSHESRRRLLRAQNHERIGLQSERGAPGGILARDEPKA